jgi:CheY-like chemotaxis protein
MGPILVVEDDEDTRLALCEVLDDQGYEAIGAASGHAALALLREGVRPCGIMLDLAMPIMNGWQFLAERAKLPDVAAIPVIVMSALPSASCTDPSLTFQRKPFHVDDILAAVQRAFGVSGQPDDLVDLQG